MYKSKRGITLIALVVTIIVLLLLAGISISMISGNNGLLKRAGDARDNTIIGQEKEQVELAYVKRCQKGRMKMAGIFLPFSYVPFDTEKYFTFCIDKKIYFI